MTSWSLLIWAYSSGAVVSSGGAICCGWPYWGGVHELGACCFLATHAMVMLLLSSSLIKSSKHLNSKSQWRCEILNPSRLYILNVESKASAMVSFFLSWSLATVTSIMCFDTVTKKGTPCTHMMSAHSSTSWCLHLSSWGAST